MIFVIEAITYSDAKEIGLDVVSGERKGGEKVVTEVIAEAGFLVELGGNSFQLILEFLCLSEFVNEMEIFYAVS